MHAFGSACPSYAIGFVGFVDFVVLVCFNGGNVAGFDSLVLLLSIYTENE